MKKKFEHKESKGLPGGPNEMFTYVTSVFDIYQAPSNIEGEGMFAGKPFKKGDLIGLAHSNGQPTSQLGRMHNHDENSPTMISKKSGNDRFVFAAKDLQPGDELTTNYRMQPELEQPEDFQYGGSVMAPPRKGVRKNPDGSESTHLMATETFDGKNWFSFPTLFQNPDGTWIDMSDKPWQEAYEEAKRRGEVIDFGTDKEAAIKFGEGSWKLPKAQLGGEPPNNSNLYPVNAEGIPMDTLDEVTVTGDRFKEKWWSPANLATFGLLNEAKRRLTKNIDPFGYDGLYKVTDALFYPNREIDVIKPEKYPDLVGKTEAEIKRERIQKHSGKPGISPLMERQQLFQYMMGQDASQYDGVPLSGEGYGLRTSKYKPTKASDPNTHYFSSPTTEYQIKNKIQEILNNENKSFSSGDVSKYELGSVLGNYHLSKGEDDKGKYISYYDIWDLDPFHPGHKYTAPSDLPLIGGMDISGNILHNLSDKFQQLGNVKPAELYGRVYYTENSDGTINVLDEKKYGGSLPKAQEGNGETPLTRKEIFNIPRTVRYEDGKMVLQDKPIWDGMLDEVTITPTTASEYAWQENRANQSTGGLEPVYPIFDLMSSGLRAPLTKGAKAVQGALTSENTLRALARSPYVPKVTKPGLIKNYKSKFPNVDLRGTGTGNYSKLGVNELGLGVDDFGPLTNYERSAISQVNQTQPADEVFNTFVQRYADFNTDDALSNQLADFSRRNPRTKFEINLGTDVTPSKRMQEIFDDPELNVHNVFSHKSSGPMNPINEWGNEGRLFYDSSARNAAGEFEKNLRSYGEQGFYAANVPMGKPVKQALTYNKDGRVFDYVTETLPVSDFVVNKGLMNPDVIGNFSRYRGAGDMANQHNFLLGITNSPSVIVSGNKGFAGLKGGNKLREKIGGLITPEGGKAVPSYNNQVVPLLKQEFNLSKPFEGTFIKSPSVLETYYNSAGQASPYTNFPGILDIDDLFTTGKSNLAKGGQLPKAQDGNGEIHTVASGETFFGIANKYKLDKQDLIDANPGLNIESIKAGQTINLPVIEKMEPIAISAADSKREPTSWTDYINPYNWGVTDRDDDGTFNQAFRAARNASEDEFMWYGTRYNTNLKPTPDKLEVEEVSNEVEAVKETGPFENYSVTPELLYKQAFVESTLDPKAKNDLGYMGLGQIGDKLIADYKKANKIDAVDPYDAKQNHDVQDWSMNELYNATFIDKPGSTNENRLLKALASYNWGRGKVKALLEEQKAKGVDIYTDTSWTSELPKETREYIDMILYDGATEKRPLVQENFKNALVDSTYKDIRDLYIYKSGGEKNQFQIYKDYVEGVYDGTEMEKAAEKIYDKLNRVYYKEAKKQGMRVPNYIMTNVIKQIDN